MYALIQKEGENRQTVFFGGSYRECWTEDYRLTIEYENRRAVELSYDGSRWLPTGGDGELLETLRSPECPAIYHLYLQAAAELSRALSLCREMGLPLTRLSEACCFGDNPLFAPELVRMLMDEHGLSLELACRTAAHCCRSLTARELDAALLYPVQPRTAHVLHILRAYAGEHLSACHHTMDPRYRSPFGAVPCGQGLRLGFRLLSGHLSRAVLVLWGDDFREEYPMEREGELYVARLTVPHEPMALWYSFRLETESSCHWLCPEENGGSCRLYGWEAGGFRLTVYRGDFQTPRWFRGCVMYQIFPDRFAFSQDDTARRGLAYHEALGQTPELHKSLTEPVRWQARPFEDSYSPDDFYGGTLKGIEEKLPYLKTLGVDCLYLNPIVEARSNHRYDTADYLRADPVLGSNEDFERLCLRAEELGIRILLDGVFSHTGADSLYFNRYGNYPGTGACQGQDSPYYSWYDFRDFPREYRCWWGFRDLPEVDEGNAHWQDYVISGDNSVVKTWLRRGAAGWRLDVADELPDAVLALLRRHVKQEKPDAPILGEVWEDAVIKESYGGRRKYALGDALDSVMNYPFRSAMLDFAHGRRDAFWLRDFLRGQQQNYPRPMYECLMNLLGSHDTERIKTALATPLPLRSLSREEQLAVPFGEAELQRAEKLEELCAAVQFAVPGVPSIYYGDEQGMCGVNDPFNRLPFREGDGKLHALYSRLCALRRDWPALREGEASFAAAHRDLLLVLRWCPEQAVLLAVNRGQKELHFRADCSEAGKGLVQGTVPPEKAIFIELQKEVCL